MRAKVSTTRANRLITTATGIVLIVLGAIASVVIPHGGALDPAGSIAALLGCLLVALGFRVRNARACAVMGKFSLFLFSAVSAMSAAEIFFRVAGHDFSKASDELPIFNRTAALHMGGGVLRRPGPAVWRGKPLSSMLHHVRGNTNAYPDEQVVEVRYDRMGFRNPPDLSDWEIVVTGDSFVESGYLSYPDIFSSVAASRLGVRVKNLGVSGTGPVFQTAYVKRFGKAPSTRHAVLCFYDGNDVSDMLREIQLTNYFARTGRSFETAERSFLAALSGVFTRRSARAEASSPLVANAVFPGAEREYPAVINWPPPMEWQDLKPSVRETLTNVVSNWAQTVRAQGMRPWVMCIPDQRRVISDRLRFIDPKDPMAGVRPGRFSPHLASICSNLNIHFVDPFPALRSEVEAGRSPYNLFGDAHLSLSGSRVVGGVLADALRPHLRSSD